MRLVGTHPAPSPRPVLPKRNTKRRGAATPSPPGNTPRRPAAADVDLPAPRTFNPAQAFAALAAARIEGGRAAILRPEARRGLMRAATAAGLRPFDATLIIAMVQDRARRGEPLAEAPADPRLTAVKLPTPQLPVATLASAAVTLALAASIFTLAITWLAGA